MPERTVPIDPPFDLFKTMRALGVGTRVEDAWVLSTFTEDGLATIAVTVDDHDAVIVRGRGWGNGADMLLDRLPTMVGADDPIWGGPVPPALRDLDAVSRGLRLGASGVMYETAVSTVLGQLVTTKESKASFRLMRARLGTDGLGPFPSVRAFPEPSTIGDMGYDELHEFGVERKRATTIIEVSRRARRMDEALQMEPSAAKRRLEAVAGVGPWTASILMGSVYGDRDSVTVGDYHLPNTVAWALAGEPRGDDQRMLELLEPYRPYRRRVQTMLKQAGIHAPKYGPRTAVRHHL